MALTVGELAVELDARTTQFRSALRAAESRLDRFEATSTRRTAAVGRSFARMGGQVAAVTAAVGALAAAFATLGLGRFVAAGIREAATFESIGVSLEVLTGSAEAAAKVLEQVNELVVETPFGLEEVASAARQLGVIFADDTDKIIEFTRITADLAAATNKPIQQIGENLSRAFSAGLASAEVFREAGITRLILQQAMVTDVAKLSTEQLEEALRGLTSEGGRAFQAALRQAQTLGGSISNTTIAFRLFRTEVGKAIGPALGRVLNTIIIPAFQRLQEVVKQNADVLATGFLRSFRAVITVGSAVIETMANLISFLNDIGITSRNVGIALQILIQSFGGFFSAAGIGFRTIAFLFLQLLADLSKLPQSFRDAADQFKRLANQDTSQLQRRLRDLREQASRLAQEAFVSREGGLTSQARIIEEQLETVRRVRREVEAELQKRGAELRIEVPVGPAQAAADKAFNGILMRTDEFGVELAGRLITIQTLVSDLFDTGAEDDAKIVATMRRLLELSGLAQEEIDKLIKTIEEGGLAGPEQPTAPPKPPPPGQLEQAGTVIGKGIGDGVAEGIKRALEGEAGTDLVTEIGAAMEEASTMALEESFKKALMQLSDGLQDVLSKAGDILGSVLGGEDGPLGAIGDFISSKLGPEGGKLLGNIAVGVIGKGLQAFRREEDVRSMSAANITSAVSSVERVRGIVAGPTQIAVAQVDRAIQTSFLPTERLLALIEQNTRATAQQANDTGTGSLPTGGTSAATAALANEGPSLV